MAASTIDHDFCQRFEHEFGGAVTFTDKDKLPHKMNGPAVEIPKVTQGGLVFQVRHRIVSQKGPYWGWYFHGVPHRIGGPAKIYGVDQDRVEWWVNGIRFFEEEKEDYEAACIEFCKRSGIAMSIAGTGRMTKRANPN